MFGGKAMDGGKCRDVHFRVGSERGNPVHHGIHKIIGANAEGLLSGAVDRFIQVLEEVFQVFIHGIRLGDVPLTMLYDSEIF